MHGERMHFEILVEDVSGKAALEILVPKIVDQTNTYRIHSYKGVGRIPKDLKSSSDPQKRILLNRLPSIIAGYGSTFQSYPPGYNAALVVICDLDKRCLSEFRRELLNCLNKCNVRPICYFCIAVEEGEAWLLGDIDAVKFAYPNAKDSVLKSYANDSICGTWEILADAVFPQGAQALKRLGWQRIGKEKSVWASEICPNMDVDINRSPSFCYFRDKLRNLAS